MQQLIEGACALGLTLTAGQQAAFQLYYEELVDWNTRINLTAITGYEEIQTRHFLDSLSCLLAEEIRDALTRPETQAIDVGSGAGFPGIPIKLIFPQLRLTLLEATGKKVDFLKHLVRRLELNAVTPVHTRAELLAHDAAHRESYDLALSRAVAELPALAEYTLPFCKIGGWVVAYKGESGAAEAQAARRAIAILGGELQRVLPVRLAGLPQDRCLILIRKVQPTPGTYPRRPGVPQKRPL